MADIIVDTYKLNQYAQRIAAVNSRISRLDRRLDSLYWRIGLQGLWNLMQADALTCYSWKLLRCQAYLQQTAAEFEQVEKDLGGIDPLSFNPPVIALPPPFLRMESMTNKRVGITGKYFSIFSEYVSGKIDGYIKKIKGCSTNEEIIVEWYTWFKDDLYSDLDTLKGMIEDIAEEMTFRKPDLLPGKIGEFFDTLDDCEVLIDVTIALRDWHNTGDGWQAYQDIGFALFSTIAKKGNKWLDEKNNLKYLGVDKQLQGVLLDTIIEMPQKWIEGIKDYATNGTGTAGRIVTDTVMGSLVESTADAAKPAYILGTAVTYPVVDQICEAVGYDLSAEYEKLTGETGLEAVFSAQKELWVDIVYEGAKEKIAQTLDKAYGAIGKGWEHWKSGMKYIMGKG